MQIIDSELEKYKQVQALAKDALTQLKEFISPGVSEAQIASRCDELLRINGADSSWYHGVGAMVFVGERTALSMSGREYIPTQKVVGELDLVTVDVSPEIDGYWGDCARSFLVGGPSQQTFREGLEFVEMLHEYFRSIVEVDLTFGKLFEIINQKILNSGYENLDFRSNLGHTIDRSLSDRRFIEKGSKLTLSDAGLFTFEPHVRKRGDSYGFRKEDIYCLFENSLISI